MNFIEGLVSRLKREPKPTDPVVQLIRIAEGQARFPGMELPEADIKRHWLILRNNIYRTNPSSKIVHQLRAVRELGESGNQKALDYLREFYQSRQSQYYYDSNCSEGAPLYYAYYPNAKEPLAEWMEWDDTHPERLDSDPHLTIRTAISNLEKSLSE